MSEAVRMLHHYPTEFIIFKSSFIRTFSINFFFRINFLRHIKDFFGIMFKFDVDKPGQSEDDDEEQPALGGDKVLLTCVGVGFRNLSKVTM